jgi:hypothetical protein
MASALGRGFVTNLLHICKHFSGRPEEAFCGAADHMEEFIVPDQFKGTEIEELADRLRKRIVWHTPGTLDKEEAEEVRKIIDRLVIAIDKALGIKDPELGEFQ